MKLDMIRRFAFIETRLFWSSGVTAAELGQAFGLSRQAAQAVIKAYRDRYPGQFRLDKHRKRHVASDGFEPQVIRRGTSAFLDYLRGQALLAHYLEDDEWSEVPFVDVGRFTRPVMNEDMVRAVLTALYHRRVATIRYQSKKRLTYREISPHHLLFAGKRYHIRAYCHKAQAYRDFVLSRILDAELTETEWVSAREDRDWNEYEVLVFQPIETDEETRSAIRLAYPAVGDGRLVIRCRKALSYYVERDLVGSLQRIRSSVG